MDLFNGFTLIIIFKKILNLKIFNNFEKYFNLIFFILFIFFKIKKLIDQSFIKLFQTSSLFFYSLDCDFDLKFKNYIFFKKYKNIKFKIYGFLNSISLL